ncbi:MAG TPA: hypothetical protein PLL69_05610 [Gemmatimonadales bacterium]|nr:hypothetical protein [Gemmatimonadales bacterium]
MRHFATILLLSILAAPLSAQVGIPPADSPYRDILPGTTFEGAFGRISGNGGPLHAGPRDATMFSVRALLRANRTLSIGFGLWRAAAVRTVIDPTLSPAEQETGEVDQDITGLEALVQFNVTGGKRWHFVAPFAGVGLGAGISPKTEDPYAYEFGTKFYFAPMVGGRIFLAERMYLRLEAKATTWKLKYPGAWSIEPADDPGTTENPNAVNPTGREGQYVVAPTLSVGFGFAF